MYYSNIILSKQASLKTLLLAGVVKLSVKTINYPFSQKIFGRQQKRQADSLPSGGNKMLQTGLYCFSYKKGSLLPICKRCRAENFYKNGKNKQGIQRYLCKECGFRFVWASDLPRRNYFSNIASFAIEMYTSPRMCASLRGGCYYFKKSVWCIG